MIFNLAWLPARQTGSSTRTKVLLRIMLRDTMVCEDDLVKQALKQGHINLIRGNMLTSFETKLVEEFDSIQKKVKRPNILLVGATGVGKSSLINCIFGSDIAPVGVGMPVTKGVHPYR